jgi:shikimate kinase
MEIRNNIISLIGMTGCGKSAVGRVLSKRMGARLVDLDDEIVARHGNIRKIFDEQGEAAFRAMELQTLAEVIREADGTLTVLSCGGGLPTWEPSRKLLRETTTVIWLRRSPESVAKDANVLARPPVNGSVENYRSLLAARYPLYRETAELSFYNAFPQRTAAAIMKKIARG